VGGFRKKKETEKDMTAWGFGERYRQASLPGPWSAIATLLILAYQTMKPTKLFQKRRGSMAEKRNEVAGRGWDAQKEEEKKDVTA
jgi:hypothetical protein